MTGCSSGQSLWSPGNGHRSGSSTRQEAAATHPATILAQLDHFADPATGALVPPLQLGVTSRWPQSVTDAAGAYARSGNGATGLVEAILAQLEGGAAAAAFNSGTAAAQAVLSTLRPGDHVLFDAGGYYEFSSILAEFGERWGVAVQQAEMTEPGAVRAMLRPGRTRLVWADCPTNPLWRVPDLPALAACAHEAGARLLVDATAATPVLCAPLLLGADYVLHSATKFLNGHGDVLAGVLSARTDDPAWQALLTARTRHGSVLQPSEAWLLLRGLRTLALRMERASASALHLAAMLAAHPAVTAVHYPGLPGTPGHGNAERQFTGGFGGMLSFQVGGSAQAALALCGRLALFRRATSFGSTESLAEHRHTTEGPLSACPVDLVRLSIGLEDVRDLQADLVQALG